MVIPISIILPGSLLSYLFILPKIHVLIFIISGYVGTFFLDVGRPIVKYSVTHENCFFMLQVAVTVHESPQYEIVDGADSAKVQECVQGQSKVVTVVKIKPSALGQVNITVGAVVDHQYPGTCGTKDTSINRRQGLMRIQRCCHYEGNF